MTKCVVVLPSIVPSMTVECLASLHPSIISPQNLPSPPTRQRDTQVAIVNGEQWSDGSPDFRLVVVWNTPEHNAGCSASWNLGVDEMYRTDADWLVVLSAAVRFGEAGGRDFLDADELDAWATISELMVEAGNHLGWHLIAFSRQVLDEVGRFDPIFHPAYFEDNDWSVRYQRAYDCDTHAPGWVGPLWPKVPVDATLVEVAHGIKHSSVEIDMEGLRQKMIAKWGPNEEYRHPYDDESLPVTVTGPYPA